MPNFENYVCVSGLRSREEFEAIAELPEFHATRQYDNNALRTIGRIPMFGIQASWKTQWLDTPNSHPCFPVGEQIADLFAMPSSAAWEMMDYVHRATDIFNFERITHINTGGNVAQMGRLASRILARSKYRPGFHDEDDWPTGKGYWPPTYPTPQQHIDALHGCDGFQLNELTVGDIRSSKLRELLGWLHAEFRTLTGGTPRLILQLGQKTLDNFHYQPHALARVIPAAVTDVLIDTSGGNGVALRYEQIAPFVDALSGQSYNVGIAGGLCAENIIEILAKFQDYTLSIDAQGQLMDQDGRLDIARVRDFFAASTRA